MVNVTSLSLMLMIRGRMRLYFDLKANLDFIIISLTLDMLLYNQLYDIFKDEINLRRFKWNWGFQIVYLIIVVIDLVQKRWRMIFNFHRIKGNVKMFSLPKVA